MKKNDAMAAVFLIITIVLLAGCTSGQTKAASTPTSTDSKQLAKNFYGFDKESYDAALKDGKFVFLDFYANWCPICKSEGPNIKAAFNALEDDNLIGFQVNFNDDHTDADEKALAKKFNVPYQHTKLVILPNETVLSRSYKGPSSEQEILEQIESSIGQ